MIRAVIISAQRSGGLFLAGCLSNHPDISCPREEIFKRETIWQRKIRLNHGHLLDFVLSQPFYKVNACRLTYDQIFNPEIEAWIKKNQIRLIHLTRMILPTVTSTLLAKMEMSAGTPRHYFDDSFKDDEILEVTPEEVIHRIKHLLKQRKAFQERFGSDRLELKYEEITKHGWMLPQEETVKICDFLEIQALRLTTQNRKMHRRPVRSYYKNWIQIEIELEKAFPDLLLI